MKQVYWINVYELPDGQQYLGLPLMVRFTDPTLWVIKYVGRWKVTLK